MGSLFPWSASNTPIFSCGYHFSTAETVSGRYFTRYTDRSICLHRQRAFNRRSFDFFQPASIHPLHLFS
ncbi:hypothetical protein LZ31DRAFT_4860 [Colletotrichum somersetense]|nr:hypothetical protein LZ31DRAFT_4860 [Colletotrichum somersetense]